MNKKKGIFYTIVSATAFGVTPLLCASANKLGASPETLVFLRNLFVIPVLFIVCKVMKVDLKMEKTDLKHAFIVGVFGMTATALLLYNAYLYLPVGTVTTVHFLYPVFVALIGLIVFKEKISKVKAIVLCVATAGIFFFLDPNAGDSSNVILGLILSVASGLTYAFYMSGVEIFKLNKINSYKLTLYLAIFSAIVMFFYSIVTGKLTLSQMAPLAYVYAFIIGIGTSFLAVYTLQLGIKYLGASTAAIFCMFEPVTAVIGELIVFGTPMTLFKVIGCIVILGSVTLLTILDKNAEESKEIQEGYEVRDIAGKTIMPGLIDTHLHFSGNLTDDDSEWVLEHSVQKTVVAVQQAHECLEHGLTTVGEISRSGLHIRNMIEAGVMSGLRVVGTGTGFCRTCGHGDSHRLPTWYNNESHPWAERVDGPWELRKAVRAKLRENPDAIKIWSTGGGIWRWDQKLDQHYTFEEIKAVVDECNMVGIPVWSHAEGYGGALDSAKAGVHLIIHGQTLNDECLDIMAEKGIYFCPTIQFLNEWFKTYEPPYIPEVHDQFPGDTVAEKELNRVYGNLRKAKEKGIVLTIGSDSFCSSLTPYGTTAIGEMYSFVEKAGISNMDTIVAATKDGAEMLKVGDITGTLEAGKFADLLVIEGNPLEDIRAIAVDNMEIIMKEGAFVRG